MDKRIERLYSRRRFGIKLGLDVVRAMLDELGNPQDTYGIIHVAGTNGKGSVCAMLESVLTATGCKVGMYTSPHLVNLNERFRVGQKEVGDVDLAELMKDIEDCASTVEKAIGREPTFFECTTVMAFEHFRRAGAQIAVIETGMGGRFDATNVVMPIISVITRISLEHTEHLGDDIESIAGEKAGIIKTGRPVVCGAMSEDAASVIIKQAGENGAQLMSVLDSVSIGVKAVSLEGQKVTLETQDRSYGTVLLPLLGSHQLENLATCAAASDALDAMGVNITIEDFKKGIMNISWPGRAQLLNMVPPVVLDGAHNPGAAEVIARTLEKDLGLREIGLVVGMCSDKDMKSFLKPFKHIVKRVWAVPVANERGSDPDAIVAACREIGLDAVTSSLADSLTESKEWADKCGDGVCITGSLFLVGEVLEVTNEKSD